MLLNPKLGMEIKVFIFFVKKKVNVIVRLEFESAYLEVAVQLFNYYATGS